MIDVRRVTPEEYAGSPAAAIAAVREACRHEDGRDPLDEAADLHLRHQGLTDAALWLADGGFALVRSGENAELDLAVAPARRRTGVGTALIEQALAAAPSPVVAWSHADHPGAAALARSHGFARIRELLVLVRPVAPGDLDLVPDPRIRSFEPDDAEDLLRVNAAAFVAHPEQGAMDAAQLAQRMAEPWFDPAGLLVATDGDRMLGFHWTKVHANGQGEVYVLAVSPEAQGTGIGRALTASGLRHLAQRGCPSVHLYVEGTNTAALALYRGLGFAPDHIHVQYRRS